MKCAGCRALLSVEDESSCTECFVTFCSACSDDHLELTHCMCCGPSMRCAVCLPENDFKRCVHCGAFVCSDCEVSCSSPLCTSSFASFEATVCKMCICRCKRCEGDFCPLHVHYWRGYCSKCFFQDHVNTMVAFVLSLRHSAVLREPPHFVIKFISFYIMDKKRGDLMFAREMSILQRTSFRGLGIYSWRLPSKEAVLYIIYVFNALRRLFMVDSEFCLSLSKSTDSTHVVYVKYHG